MSLQTPDKIRILQRKLYLKAKAEPDCRFYLLYDKICREDNLGHADDLMRANDGAPGVDGVSFAMIEAEGREEWLAGIRKDLQEKTYRPAPVRRVMIPKPGGKGERQRYATGWFRRHCAWCWNRSLNGTLPTEATTFAPTGDAKTHCGGYRNCSTPDTTIQQHR